MSWSSEADFQADIRESRIEAQRELEKYEASLPVNQPFTPSQSLQHARLWNNLKTITMMQKN